LKYDQSKVSYLQFMDLVLEYQPLVRCCAVMPHSDWRESEKIYGYVPEEPISAEQYDRFMAEITPVLHEPYEDDVLACGSGACPIEPDINAGIVITE
jgi:hypothetical protein